MRRVASREGLKRFRDAQRRPPNFVSSEHSIQQVSSPTPAEDLVAGKSRRLASGSKQPDGIVLPKQGSSRLDLEGLDGRSRAPHGRLPFSTYKGAPTPAIFRSRQMRDPFIIPGMDRRTSEGRRYRDTVVLMVSEFGAGDPVRIRELTTLRLSLEPEGARIVTDPKRSSRELVHVSEAVAAKEEELRARA